MNRIPLAQALEYLQKTYGRPKPPVAANPWHLILWENVAYMADDKRRQQAFAILQKRVGMRPKQLNSAHPDVLLEIASYGIMPESRVETLRRCAQIAIEEFDGNLQQVLDLPIRKAKKALQKFPGIGRPGAEKILLFCRRHQVLALESNGLRVLLRLGFGRKRKSYSATYSLVQAAAAQELQQDYAWLIAAYQLLRRHGQELCRKSNPLCDRCLLASKCNYYRTLGPS